MSFTLRIFTALSLLAPVGADAREWMSPGEADALCALSAPVLLPTSGDAAECPDDSCAETWVEVAETARDYARERGQWLTEPHEVIVAPAGYAVPRYDADLGVLSIPLDAPVHLFGGIHYLALDAPVVAFEMRQSQAETLISQYRAGSLSLRLVFSLAASAQPHTEICLPDDAGDIVFEAQLQTAELLQPVSSHSHCRMDTLRNVRAEVMFGPYAGGRVIGAIPSVEVTQVTTDDETAPEVAVISELLEASLVDCFVEGLELNPAVQGALTIETHFDASGQLQDPIITRDLVNNPTLTSCALREIADLAVWPEPTRVDTPIRATLLFHQ